MTLAEILDRFQGLRILVAGDPMVDVYHFGRVERVSQEAPVPVFVEEHSETRLGGAANVWNQLAALGCRAVSMFDTQRERWTEKHRYMVGSHQVFRIDVDRTLPYSLPFIEQPIYAAVVSDYGKGAVTRDSFARVLEFGRPIIVDPKGDDWSKYEGASVICPNHLELELRKRHNFGRNSPHETFAVIIEKRGVNGLRLMQRDSGTGFISRQDFPSTARHVFDVTGAGDTVTALVAATVAVGGTLEQACELANLAAGYVVGEVGTTVCPIETLRSLLSDGPGR